MFISIHITKGYSNSYKIEIKVSEKITLITWGSWENVQELFREIAHGD